MTLYYRRLAGFPALGPADIETSTAVDTVGPRDGDWHRWAPDQLANLSECVLIADHLTVELALIADGLLPPTSDDALIPWSYPDLDRGHTADYARLVHAVAKLNRECGVQQLGRLRLTAAEAATPHALAVLEALGDVALP